MDNISILIGEKCMMGEKKEDTTKLITEVLEILRSALIPRKQGGIYESNHANPLRKEVLKAIALLEDETKR